MQCMEVNLDRAREMVIECMKKQLTTMISGSPGLGKSSIVKQIAQEFNLEVLDVRLSTCDVTDLSGLPNFKNGKATFMPFDIFPTEDTPIPQGKSGWILLLDEFNSASRNVAAAAYKLVLDRMVGNHKLHPNCFIVCAGNKEEDNAIVNDLGTAMQSRLVHINVCVDNDVWLKNVALKEKYDPRIIAYIKSYPEDLMNFNPEHTEQTFASPRTWSFANTLIKDKKSFTVVEEALVIGCLGMSVGSKFITYTKIFNDIPVFEDILKEPETVNIPDELNKQWALLCMVMQKVNEDNLNKLVAFIDRFDTSFKVLFYKNIFMRNDSLKSNKLVRSKIMEIAQYVYD